MVGRIHESVDLPDFVRRQAQAEGWHLRAAAALDHGLQKALVAELRRKEVRPPRAGAVVADVALACTGDPAGGDGVGLAKEGVGQLVIAREAAAHRQQRHRRRQRETEK